MKSYSVIGYSTRFGMKHIDTTDSILDAIRVLENTPKVFKSVGIFTEDHECIFEYTHGYCLCNA